MASHLSLLRAPPFSIPTKNFHSKYTTIKPLKPTINFPPSSSSSFFHCSSIASQRGSCSSLIACSSLNGRGPNDSVDDGVKSVEQLVEEKQRAELSARIASGEFTVKQESGYGSKTLKFSNFHSFLDLLS